MGYTMQSTAADCHLEQELCYIFAHRAPLPPKTDRLPVPENLEVDDCTPRRCLLWANDKNLNEAARRLIRQHSKARISGGSETADLVEEGNTQKLENQKDEKDAQVARYRRLTRRIAAWRGKHGVFATSKFSKDPAGDEDVDKALQKAVDMSEDSDHSGQLVRTSTHWFFGVMGDISVDENTYSPPLDLVEAEKADIKQALEAKPKPQHPLPLPRDVPKSFRDLLVGKGLELEAFSVWAERHRDTYFAKHSIPFPNLSTAISQVSGPEDGKTAIAMPDVDQEQETRAISEVTTPVNRSTNLPSARDPATFEPQSRGQTTMPPPVGRTISAIKPREPLSTISRNATKAPRRESTKLNSHGLHAPASKKRKKPQAQLATHQRKPYSCLRPTTPTMSITSNPSVST